MTFNNLIRVFVLCALAVPTMVSADPVALFNKAISDAKQISQNVPTKDRLAAYERVISGLDQILMDFPASQEARTLLTGQRTGSFAPNKLRLDYVDELTAYHEKVCEVSPSYTCLAFVSLKEGKDICAGAGSVSQLEVGYEHLANALKIFASQAENRAFEAVTVSTARQCSNRNLNQWARDFFDSKLVEMLLLAGRERAARAIVENMETAYFKFEGVLAMRIASGAKADKQYVDRLDRYIVEKIAVGKSATKAPVDAFLATLRLRTFALQHSNAVMSRDFIFDAVQRYRRYSDTDTYCDPQYSTYLFNLLLDFQIALHDLPEDRREFQMSKTLKKGTYSGEEQMMQFIGSHPREYLNNCADGEYYDLSLMIRIHGRILYVSGKDAAAGFRQTMKDRSMTREELIDLYLTIISPTEEDLTLSYFITRPASGNFDPFSPARAPVFYVGAYDEETRWRKVKVNGSTRSNHGLSFNPATFPVFKRLVDFGSVCQSSQILFQELANTTRFDEAIKYMIESPAIDPGKRHSCGDEGLELLLAD